MILIMRYNKTLESREKSIPNDAGSRSAEMCREFQSNENIRRLFCVRRDRMARPQDIELYEMAIWETRVAMLGIDIVCSDRIVSAADISRDMFSHVITSTVEYKGAGDFLVQHAERVITAQQRLAREGGRAVGKPLHGFARYEFPPHGGPPLKLEREHGHEVRRSGGCVERAEQEVLRFVVAGAAGRTIK